MPFLFDPLGSIVALIGFMFAMIAQAKVKSAYRKYSRISVHSGITGADVARNMMAANNIDDVGLELVPGEMTDHYDPTAKMVRLSENVYYGCTIAALGIAAHEIGHVIQHNQGYAPLKLRHIMYPVSSIGSKLGYPIFIAGMIFSNMGFGILMNVGIWLFAAAAFFSMVTLPVEFNASRRAMAALNTGGYLNQEELYGAKKVLGAAAMTYVASLAAILLQLLYMILRAQSRR